MRQLCIRKSRTLGDDLTVQMLDEIPAFSNLKRADALVRIPSEQILLIVEITGRLNPSDEAEKLRSTLDLAKANGLCNAKEQVLGVVHYEKASSLELKLLNAERVAGHPPFQLRCDGDFRNAVIAPQRGML